MATSRTGTAEWKKLRRRTLDTAQAAGLTRCPWCKCPLDYEHGRRPNSAEVDHVHAYAATGSNQGPLGVICRRCNQSKGARAAPNMARVMRVSELRTSRRW